MCFERRRLVRLLRRAVVAGLLALLLTPASARGDDEELAIWQGDTVVVGPNDARAVIVDTLVLHEDIVSARPTTRRISVTGLEPGTSIVRAYGRTRSGEVREAWSILVRVLDVEEIRSETYVVAGARQGHGFPGPLRLGTRDGLEGPDDRAVARVRRNTDHHITIQGRRVGSTTLVARYTRPGDDGSEERVVETLTIHVVASSEEIPFGAVFGGNGHRERRARAVLPDTNPDDGFPTGGGRKAAVEDPRPSSCGEKPGREMGGHHPKSGRGFPRIWKSSGATRSSF